MYTEMNPHLAPLALATQTIFTLLLCVLESATNLELQICINISSRSSIASLLT